MHPIFDLVNSGIAKSKSLLLLAEEQEWDQFTELDVERQAVLRSIKLEGLMLSDVENDRLHELMNQLISLNEQLEAVCTQQRSDAAEELQKIRKGNKVNKAYSQ
ncbi:MAG: hypothetical protein GQ547_08075 [Methylophaga sp.]|nr:hypothetical protein [Methylophaga sp.]